MGGLNMEILNNFSSIYCFITFIIGAMFMFAAFCIAAMCKTQESKNKVHFYVARDKDNSLWLYLGKPERSKQTFMPITYGGIIRGEKYFSNHGLYVNDYANLKWEDEPVEVFLKLEN